MLYEERLERAEQRRLQGNQLFAEGKYREALAKYAVVGVALSWCLCDPWIKVCIGGLRYVWQLFTKSKYRLQGNQLFARGKYREALAMYAVVGVGVCGAECG
mgnify:CR=1 FL=1